MLVPVRRVCVTITPRVFVAESGTEEYEVRIGVETWHHAFVQDLVLKPNDFESRFDLLFDMAKRTLSDAIQREANTPQTESINGEAQKGDAPGLHA